MPGRRLIIPSDWPFNSWGYDLRCGLHVGPAGRVAEDLRIRRPVLPPDRGNGALLGVARREGRVLLTRDRGLLERTAGAPPASSSASEKWEDQLVQVLDEFHLGTRSGQARAGSPAISRSSPSERARNLVTPYVCEHAASFAVCPGCDRVFWHRAPITAIWRRRSKAYRAARKIHHRLTVPRIDFRRRFRY